MRLSVSVIEYINRLRRNSRLRIDRASVTDPTTILDALRIVVRPVHEPAEIVPLVHAANPDTIAHAERHALGQVDIVGNQQGPVVADIDDEPLVAGAVVVVMQKAVDEAGNFDPPPVIAFRETDAFSSRSAAPS